MHDNDLWKLEILREKNVNHNWVNKRLYPLMFREDLYITAYQRLKSKPGNMTPGPDGSTLDGFSLEIIRNIIQDMRTEKFKFSRARRVYIPKASGGERPLAVAPPRDKIVQEVIRMILETIYDSPKGPRFSNHSHGFRPGKSCHTALKEIRNQWTGVKWIIEGDIKGCFDNIDHDLLIRCLERYIEDPRFINLIRKALSAGYLEFFTPVNSWIGTPQGSVLSPLLANVFLHELDCFVDGLKDEYEEGSTKLRRNNPVYRNIQYKILKVTNNLGNEELSPQEREILLEQKKELLKLRASTPSGDQEDPKFIRVKYVRYADDWIVGVIGSKKLAQEIKERIGRFLLDEMKLTLSEEKTHIRHAKTEPAFFLGTIITVGDNGEQVIRETERKQNDQDVTFNRRSTGWTPTLKAPVKKIVQRLHLNGFCDGNGFPEPKTVWSVLDDEQIIDRFNAVLLGITNYYSFVNYFSNLTRIQYILKFSAAKTLATKHKTTIAKVFAKYGKNLSIKNPLDKKKTKKLNLITKWTTRPQRFQISDKKIEPFDYHQKIRSRSKMGARCVICDSDDSVVMHHVRHIRTIDQKVKGFDKILQMINRKQLPVCNECHVKIHNGSYDGIALSDFADPKTASM